MKNVLFVNERLSIIHKLFHLFYHQDFLSFAFYFYSISTTDFSLFHLLSLVPCVYWPAGLQTSYHLMKQRLICAWVYETEKEHDEHMTITWNCTASNKQNLPFKHSLFYSPFSYQFFPSSHHILSATFSDRSIPSRPRLSTPPYPLLALAEKPVWDVHCRIKKEADKQIRKKKKWRKCLGEIERWRWERERPRREEKIWDSWEPEARKIQLWKLSSFQ